MASKTKRLRQALAQINENNNRAAKRCEYEAWLEAQPWSTHRGMKRGTFVFPPHIAATRALLGIS